MSDVNPKDTLTKPWFDTDHMVSFEEDQIGVFIPSDVVESMADKIPGDASWPTEGIVWRVDINRMVDNLIDAYKGEDGPIDPDASRHFRDLANVLEAASARLRAETGMVPATQSRSIKTEVDEFFRILSLRGYGRIAYDAQMAKVIAAVRADSTFQPIKTNKEPFLPQDQLCKCDHPRQLHMAGLHDCIVSWCQCAEFQSKDSL